MNNPISQRLLAVALLLSGSLLVAVAVTVVAPVLDKVVQATPARPYTTITVIRATTLALMAHQGLVM